MRALFFAVAIAGALTGCSNDEISTAYDPNPCAEKTSGSVFEWGYDQLNQGQRQERCRRQIRANVDAKVAAFALQRRLAEADALKARNAVSPEQQQRNLDALMNNGGYQRSLAIQRQHDAVDNFNAATGIMHQCNAGVCW